MTQVADLAGQRFIVDFSGPEITPDLERLIRDGRIAGIILFAKNIRTAHQVRRLTGDLQRVAAEAGLPPLLITIDQEGGPVNRLVEGVTVFPSAMAVGASGRVEDAATAGRVTAMELRSLGINTNHAPVLDVNSNPDNPVIGVRAYGDDPISVARLGVAYIRAAQEAGVLTTAKHFPGHGATSVDSHVDLPVITKELQRLRQEEVLPFAEAVRAGADGIMAAHIMYPALDANRPASLSPQILTTLLRGELGFEGVVVTDSMAMRAIADRWPRGPAAVAALQAGNDLILACGQSEAQWESIQAVRQAVKDGTLAGDTLSVSADRIARVKARYALALRPDNVPDSMTRRQAQEIADRAVTMVRNRKQRIPLPPGRTAVLATGEERGGLLPLLGSVLASTMSGVTVASERTEVMSGAWDNVVVVSLSSRAAQSVEIIEALRVQFGQKLVVVGAGDPYELLRLPDVDTYIAAYGADPASMLAVARVLSGEIRPSGRLPVALPGLYPRGHAA